MKSDMNDLQSQKSLEQFEKLERQKLEYQRALKEFIKFKSNKEN